MTATWRDRWALEDHFDDHGREVDAATPDEYHASALDTIAAGIPFTYTDRDSGRPRLGYYDPSTNRFTGLSPDGRRIYTHFPPTNGENYVRGLQDTTYGK